MSVIFGILLFSFLIVIHELGHFIAAKLSGVQVNEFSVFMGPAIFKKQKGETLYSIRCIPFGGYCAMEGEDEDTDNPRSFQKAAWWKKLIILVAGAAVNFIAGVILLYIVFAPAKNFIAPVIDSTDPGCTIVSEDGFHVGDRLLEMDGEKIYVASDFSMLLNLYPGEIHDFVVERNGEKIRLDGIRMEKHEFTEPDGQKTERFGFSFGIEKATFGNRLSYTWNSTRDVVRSVWLSLRMLVTGKAGIKDISGPIGIVQIMSNTAAASPTKLDALLNMLYFGGFIAINLAVMNMLPIPALDGGRVFFLLINTAIEAVTGKKINSKYEGYIHAAGMILLLILMAVVMFKDIFVLFKR